MKVQDLMKPRLVSVPPNMTWSDAVAFMMKEGVSAVPVIDGAEGLVGILSEKDLFHGIFPSYRDWMMTPEAYLDFERMEDDIREVGNRPVSELMSKRLVTAGPETPILKVGALMSASNIHQVPVMEDGKLIGMVTRGKIYNEIAKKYFGLSREKK